MGRRIPRPDREARLEITVRDAVTVVHGMGFGALLLLGFSGAFVGLHAMSHSSTPSRLAASERRLFILYLAGLALLAWMAVFAGAYLVYPWYRAHPPAGAVDLTGFPQRLLMSNPATTGWHDIGMEWKEHIAWFSPISLTALAYLAWRYGASLGHVKGLRAAVFGLTLLAFTATGVAGFFGAMLNKYAPVRGGHEIVLMKAQSHD
jgi:hypothetical protein